ncbi:hypothetical protein MLD38_014509 [Melastoma candidum]|uniref:Uncharacterized protein n=1 Tax=Melastoma candidum TaxID=119954 RepID=A0ACB9RG53_9MYRT|nr:hypothetical protein MLD38_014509 [Melastoma candidum]
MELLQFQPLLAAVAIAKEAAMIFRRNRRFMIPVASFGILLYSILVVTNFLYLRHYLASLMEKLTVFLVTSPMSAEYANLLIGLQQDISFFFSVEWIFVVGYSVTALLFSTGTMYGAAISHLGKDTERVDIRDLAKLTAASWKRPLVTSLYTSIFGIGYASLVTAILLPLALPRATFTTTVLSLVASLLYAYLSIIWTVGLVVSALESRSGIEALGEAERLVKGMRIQGYALSLFITVTSMVIFQLWRLVSFKQPWWNELIVFIVVNLMWLVRMFGVTCYTLYYYDCKSFHGEEVSDNELMINGDDSIHYTPV